VSGGLSGDGNDSEGLFGALASAIFTTKIPLRPESYASSLSSIILNREVDGRRAYTAMSPGMCHRRIRRHGLTCNAAVMIHPEQVAQEFEKFESS
jgi:hypothetical protein